LHPQRRLANRPARRLDDRLVVLVAVEEQVLVDQRDPQILAPDRPGHRHHVHLTPPETSTLGLLPLAGNCIPSTTCAWFQGSGTGSPSPRRIARITWCSSTSGTGLPSGPP